MPNYELNISINQKIIDIYDHNGQKFVEGRKGSEFEIVFTNNTNVDALAIISVDGLDILDGKPASNESSGYVVSPFQTVSIPGWRLDNENVAKFVFSNTRASYSNRIGHGTKNVGVIGCLVYRSKERKYNPILRGITWQSSGYDDVIMSSACQDLGTGFGHQDSHIVNTVQFEKEDHPVASFAIYYDSRKGLQARGIDLRKKSRYMSTPNPFPGMGCQPPVGWKG